MLNMNDLTINFIRCKLKVNCLENPHYAYTEPLAASRTQPTTWQIHLDNDVYNSIIKRHETIYSFINSDFNSNSL